MPIILLDGGSTCLKSRFDVPDEVSPGGHLVAALALIAVNANSRPVSGGHAAQMANVLTTQVASDAPPFGRAFAAVFAGVYDPRALSVLVAAAFARHVAHVVSPDGAGQVALVAH